MISRLQSHRSGRRPEAKGSKINRKPGGYKFSRRLLQILPLAIVLCCTVSAQNIPDRIVQIDPLGDTTIPSDRFVPLPAARLFGEFARYTNGSGENHRWNARTGGYLEFARFSGDWSVSIHGTMEVVMDPLNDIEFNPRAIFWEEGVIVAARSPWPEGSIQIGYTHRCKHDIDNFEVFATRGEREQRTLIYSGPFLRLLRRPVDIATPDGLGRITLGGAIRGDYYFHRLDDRSYTGRLNDSGSIEDLDASASLSGRLGLEFQGSIVGLHLAGALQSSLRSGPAPDRGLDLLLSWGEFALDLRNPTGMTFSVYLRHEAQRDGGILVTPTPATLLSIGVRGSSIGIW